MYLFVFKALIDQSTACKQKVKHVCSTNALTNLSSWTGRNGAKNSYWSGDRNSTDKGRIRKKKGNIIVDNSSVYF